MTLEANSAYEKAPVAATTANIKALPGRVFSIYASNRNAAARYLQLFDSTGATTTLKEEYLIPLSGHVQVGQDLLGASGLPFLVGITYGISTTAGSYVAATASEHDLTVRYR